MGDVWEMGRGDMFIIHKGVLLFLNFGSFTYLSSYFSQSCDSPARPPCPPSFGGSTCQPSLPALLRREQAGRLVGSTCQPSLPALLRREQAGRLVGGRLGRADWSGAGGYERLMSLRLKRPHPPYGSYDWPLSCEGEGRKERGRKIARCSIPSPPAPMHRCGTSSGPYGCCAAGLWITKSTKLEMNPVFPLPPVLKHGVIQYGVI